MMESNLSLFIKYLAEEKAMASNSLLAYGRDVNDFIIFRLQRGYPILMM